MSRIFRANPADVKIPRRVLAARLGFKGIGNIPEGFERYFEEAYSIALKVAEPIAIYEDLLVESMEDRLVIEGKEIRSKLALQHLSGARIVTALVSTLGSRLDEEIRRLHEEGNELLSFFLDGIGSEMVEYFTRMLDARLRKERGRGSARISPGYGDLPLSLNAWIIDRLKANEIGVSYDSETFVMKPRKTITALIGWF